MQALWRWLVDKKNAVGDGDRQTLMQRKKKKLKKSGSSHKVYDKFVKYTVSMVIRD